MKSNWKVSAVPPVETANGLDVTVEPSVPPYPPLLPFTPPLVEIQFTLDWPDGMATTPSFEVDVPELPTVVQPIMPACAWVHAIAREIAAISLIAREFITRPLDGLS
ncbi:hypothetical protein BI364_12935 [Acidihalobacter yilgarnensis]|uniref:Uncharacterized protein n=1 Tax=Acidihalobacter yilgarnensis TaxID=2819280 RepID=A0A1D8IQL9_9GAMM|nr:hypothetical protein BI364_12935 [Acidihalobacter yilgarnensis]